MSRLINNIQEGFVGSEPREWSKRGKEGSGPLDTSRSLCSTHFDLYDGKSGDDLGERIRGEADAPR